MSDDSKKRLKTLGKGIYLLPNLFTVGALFSGFYAIVAATKELFDLSALAIFVSMILDTLDGRIARLTHSQSKFGAQMDSLSDMVCFGLSPALVLYLWSLSAMGKPGWLASFFYTACTALRLARFNSTNKQKNRYFYGLATPAAAGVVASGLWTCTKYGIVGIRYALPFTFLTLVLGFLKVSTIRYRSFKDLDFKNKVPFIAILIVVLFLVLISFNPPMMLFFLFASYTLSGPLCNLWKLLRKDRG